MGSANLAFAPGVGSKLRGRNVGTPRRRYSQRVSMLINADLGVVPFMDNIEKARQPYDEPIRDIQRDIESYVQDSILGEDVGSLFRKNPGCLPLRRAWV
mmetsp:Transcript_16167/g.66888  ORF Transcript_16167/g.66888 Transcript_16167/m.66888 type:complete len:99 (+) Transcript_16167:259-555(+)